jgi:hypothetical protein
MREFIWLLWLIIPAGFFALFFCIAYFEKHPLKQLVAVDMDRLTEPSPYFLAVNESARQLGFHFAGACKQDRGSRTYQAYLCFWLSPDRTILAQIEGGKTLGIAIRRTRLLSCLADGGLLETTDEFGTKDLSGLTAKEMVVNARFEELYARHTTRLAEGSAGPKAFRTENALAVYETMQGLKASRMEELGLARFDKRTRSSWHYTAKGAWQLYFKGFKKEKAEGMAQIERSNLKRPGE